MSALNSEQNSSHTWDPWSPQGQECWRPTPETTSPASPSLCPHKDIFILWLLLYTYIWLFFQCNHCLNAFPISLPCSIPASPLWNIKSNTFFRLKVPFNLDHSPLSPPNCVVYLNILYHSPCSFCTALYSWLSLLLRLNPRSCFLLEHHKTTAAFLCPPLPPMSLLDSGVFLQVQRGVKWWITADLNSSL